MEDITIIDMFFERSEKAISMLLDKYGRFGRKLAQGILRSEEDTEECINTACMRIWNAIPPKRPENLGGYFCRIIRNIAVTEYKKERKRMENEADAELYEIIPDGSTVENQYEAKIISELINEFLGGLNKKNRTIFISRYYLGMSLLSIGDSLGMSEGAVKSRLHRLRTDLKKFLQERGVEL